MILNGWISGCVRTQGGSRSLANLWPLTWYFRSQPQRDSNPCRHLERVARANALPAEMHLDLGVHHPLICIDLHLISTSHGQRRTKFRAGVVTFCQAAI
jgi:hypothetical protein